MGKMLCHPKSYTQHANYQFQLNATKPRYIHNYGHSLHVFILMNHIRKDKLRRTALFASIYLVDIREKNVHNWALIVSYPN